MAQTQGRAEAAKESAILPLIPKELVEIEKKRVEALIKTQKELFDAIQEINLGWLERARSAASLFKFVKRRRAQYAGNGRRLRNACVEQQLVDSQAFCR